MESIHTTSNSSRPDEKRKDTSSVTTSQVPCLVVPESIKFIGDVENSHKQVVTLYNPYDFFLSYRILCTSPRKYVVKPPNGDMKARSSIDIVIKCRDPEVLKPREDKFLFEIHTANGVLVGKKVVPSVVVPSSNYSDYSPLPVSKPSNRKRKSGSSFSVLRYAVPVLVAAVSLFLLSPPSEAISILSSFRVWLSFGLGVLAAYFIRR